MHDEWTTTLGSLRTLGHYPLAADLEAFAARLERTPFVDSNDAAVVEVRQAARSLIDGLESQLRDTRRPAGSRSSQRTSLGARNSFSKFGGRVSMLLFGCLSVSTVHAADASLSQHQRESLLSEAHAVYEQACKLVDSDSLQSKEDFQAAAAKYQLLVDAGIQNAGLYVNLGNANLRSGQVGCAIVAYRRALKIDPLNQQAGLNLSFAESLLEQSSATTPGNEAGFVGVLGETNAGFQLASCAASGPGQLASDHHCFIHCFLGIAHRPTPVCAAGGLAGWHSCLC